jgi:ubiquitin-like-conjugating enzyme ATG10
MKLLLSSDTYKSSNKNFIEQYLVSWFSVVGQAVGLKMSLEMLNIVV